MEVPDWFTLVMVRASPDWPVNARRFKRLDWVVVAATVSTALTSAEVVATATLSFCAVSLTRVPSSVQPPPAVGVAHERLPDPSVCRKVDADWEEGQV